MQVPDYRSSDPRRKAGQPSTCPRTLRDDRPAGMSGHVHEFDAREGGFFRVSLTSDAPDSTGKTGPRTDTYHGRFVKLVPNKQVVEVLAFEATDPGLRGAMTMTTTLTDADGGTDVLVVHEGVP